MHECESSDDDDEVDSLGKFVVNLNNPHGQSCKTKKFITAMNRSQQKKNRILNLLQQTLSPPITSPLPKYNNALNPLSSVTVP